MKIQTRSIASAGMAAVLAAGHASAQDAGADWRLSRRPDIQSTTASVEQDGGLVAVRCREQELEVLVGGLPVANATPQRVTVHLGPIVGEDQAWTVFPGTAILSANNPARLARVMRAGGPLDLSLTPESPSDGSGQEPARLHLSLPPSSASIDQVLTACGVDLSADTDALPRLPASVTWLNRPTPEYPRLGVNLDGGTVELVCGADRAGRMVNCRVIGATVRGRGLKPRP